MLSTVPRLAIRLALAATLLGSVAQAHADEPPTGCTVTTTQDPGSVGAGAVSARLSHCPTGDVAADVTVSPTGTGTWSVRSTGPGPGSTSFLCVGYFSAYPLGWYWDCPDGVMP